MYYEDGENRNQPVTRGNRLVPRPVGTPPPCRTDRGCAKGTPEKPRALTPRNHAAYQHYAECRAVGEFPADPLVKYHAGLIHRVEERVRESREALTRTRLEQVLLLATRTTRHGR